MKASQIKVSNLGDSQECCDAIDSIENDPSNVVGGIVAWASGRQTYLTESAKKKIAAIERRELKFGGEAR